MTYPDLDHSVIDAANEARAKIMAARQKTQAGIQNLEIGLKTCIDERYRLLDLAAQGEAVPAEKTAEVEKMIRENESELARQRDILTRQESMTREAETAVRLANGKAHLPRAHEAIRRLVTTGREIDRLNSELRRAQNALAEAQGVLKAAFGAGLPLPQAFKATMSGGVWHHEKLYAETDERTVRANFGQLALEALGEPAEAA